MYGVDRGEVVVFDLAELEEAARGQDLVFFVQQKDVTRRGEEKAAYFSQHLGARSVKRSSVMSPRDVSRSTLMVGLDWFLGGSRHILR